MFSFDLFYNLYKFQAFHGENKAETGFGLLAQARKAIRDMNSAPKRSPIPVLI